MKVTGRFCVAPRAVVSALTITPELDEAQQRRHYVGALLLSDSER